jgi:polysaccharide biosynthesis/export protein
MERISTYRLSVGLCLLGLLLVVLATSCVSTKKAIYFSNLPDTIDASRPVAVEAPAYKPPVILPNDNLFISLVTSDQNETNSPISTRTGMQVNPFSGYLVNSNGYITIALIGLVKVAGLTTSEASVLITEKAKDFFKEPVVMVRIINFDVNFLGEVGRPGVSNFPNEKVNIFEGLASVGDIALTGRRNDVLLIRTEGDVRKFVRFDLNSTEAFRSPYFYLRQRDIVYVKPNKFRIQNSDNRITRNLGIVSGIVSLALLLLAARNVR